MLEKKFINALKQAGITVNGQDPWDMQVHSNRVFWSLVFGNLMLGETYLDGGWDCKQLDEFFYRLLTAKLDKRIYLFNLLLFIKFMLINAQKIARARQVGQKHYDLGNNLFQAMLDDYMQYSCGYWKGKADNLELAQLRKLDLICRKLRLRKGETVLDVGCGWGGLADYAASRYGAKVTGLTVSGEQVKLARERCQGLPVEILLQDYREYSGQFDKIVSVGMLEHVGPKNYRKFMKIVNHCLKDNGIFLLHTIGSLKHGRYTDPWVEKYIFPNGVIPSRRQILTAAEGIFTKLDEHEFGAHYDQTLMQWWQRFDAAWPELKKNPKYSERFYRMWKYYLLSCAGAFRAKKNQLYQFVFAKKTADIKNYVPAR